MKNELGTTDEMFTRNLTWEFSALLYGAERGDTMVEFVPIGEDEATQIVERIKERAASAEKAVPRPRKKRITPKPRLVLVRRTPREKRDAPGVALHA